MKIGIPRALFYYEYYPFWKTFFEALGYEVVLSTTTNKNLLKKGIELCVDDACLPIKIFHGHVADLINKVDAIFVPRIISIAPREYICPKFLGLPDMIRNSISNLPPLIDADLNLYKGRINILKHLFHIGEILDKSKSQIFVAYYKAKKVQMRFEDKIIDKQITPGDILPETNYNKLKNISAQSPSNYKILLLGHHYNIYDEFISMNLVKKLKKHKITFVTSDMVSDDIIRQGAGKLAKDMFWTLGKKTLGTAYYFLDRGEVDGIIHVASFGCGPDSLVGELLEKRTKRDYKIPFLYLNLDEHAGESGFNTRLEAFLDVLEGRKYHENYFSTYG